MPSRCVLFLCVLPPYCVQFQKLWRLWHFQCMLGYFGVSTISQTLTWITGSLTCVCDLFACMHTGGPRVSEWLWKSLHEISHWRNPRPDRRKAYHITVTRYAFGDHARSCLTLVFESEYLAQTGPLIFFFFFLVCVQWLAYVTSVGPGRWLHTIKRTLITLSA